VLGVRNITHRENMSTLRKIILIVTISFVCVGCDQFTKTVATENLQQAGRTSYLNDTVRLEYTENTGAFLGLGKSLPKAQRTLLFTIFAGAILFALLIYILFNTALNFIPIVGLTLIFSGGIGNLIDRVINNGAVVDFLNIGIGSLRTGIFNIADVALMIGVGIYLTSELFTKSTSK